MNSDQHERQARAYRSILRRALDAWQDASERAWPTLQEEVRRAAEFEAEVEDLAAEEQALLSQYVRRDLDRLARFMSETGRGLAEWLRFDLQYLEDGVVRGLAALADRSVLDSVELQHRLQADDSETRYTAGELACGGTFRCERCGEEFRLTRVEHLADCGSCGHPYFERASSR